jgi:cytochrome c
MKPISRILRALCICAVVSASFLPSFAQQSASAVASKDSQDTARTQEMLDRAVTHYKKNGQQALAAFSRAGEFLDGELYIYVLDSKGVMLASGGPSVTLVGRNILDLKDPEGKPFIREIVDLAKTKGGGAVEYRWLNRAHGVVERKVAYFKQVDDSILVVGQYIPRATAQEAKALLVKAVDAVKQEGAKSFERFNSLNGGFVQDDLYVFVLDLNTMVMQAHGSMPRLINRNVKALTDPDGKLIIQEMVRITRAKGQGELSYKWRNQVTGKKENKTSYLQRTGDYLVAVGYYQR